MVRRTRRIAVLSGLIGAGAATIGVSVAALLMSEVRTARRRVERYTPVNDPPTGNGVWGSGSGEQIVLAMMGDSSSVGMGVDDVTETPGVLVAAGLSRLSGRPVRLVRVGVSGATSRDLDVQVSDALPHRPDVAVIMIGANDVTARIPAETAAAHLAAAVRRLREAGVQVVVATCPDLGTVRPIPQPLRTLARHRSRSMAAAQIAAVVRAGGRTVALGSSLGPTFARYHELWSDDGFHPSAAGYAAAASLVLPSVADALGYWPISREDIRQRALRRRDRTVEQAAYLSSQQTGSQVTAASRISLDGTRRRAARLGRLLPVPLPVPRRGGGPVSRPDLVADLSVAGSINELPDSQPKEGR